MNQPKILDKPGYYQFWWEEEFIEVRVSRINYHSGGHLSAELAVYCRAPEYKDAPFLDRNIINLSSARSKSEWVKSINQRYKKVNWADIIEQIANHTIEKSRIGEPVIELGRTDKEIVKPSWDLYPLIVSGMPNIWFGDRGSLKSKLALYAALLMTIHDLDNIVMLGLTPPKKDLKILKLDYEGTQEADEYEWHRILRGMDMEGAVQLNYRSCLRPLADDIEAVFNHADAVKADVIIIDSLGPAAGGNLNDTEPALNFGYAVRQLKRTTLIPAHTAKNQLGKRSVFGSSFYENLGRNIWEITKEEDEDNESSIQHIALHQTKSPPFSPHHWDIAFEFDFDNDAERLQVHKYNPDKMEIVQEKKSNSQKILGCLSDGKKAMSNKEISEITGIREDVVRTTCYRLKKPGKVVKIGESWGLSFKEV